MIQFDSRKFYGLLLITKTIDNGYTKKRHHQEVIIHTSTHSEYLSKNHSSFPSNLSIKQERDRYKIVQNTINLYSLLKIQFPKKHWISIYHLSYLSYFQQPQKIH